MKFTAKEKRIFAEADKAIAELHHPTDLQTARGERLLSAIRQANKLMTQYDAKGRLVRRARYNAALSALWKQQLPFGKVEVT